jgi:hypothetical protein
MDRNRDIANVIAKSNSKKLKMDAGLNGTDIILHGATGGDLVASGGPWYSIKVMAEGSNNNALFVKLVIDGTDLGATTLLAGDTLYGNITEVTMDASADCSIILYRQ